MAFTNREPLDEKEERLREKQLGILMKHVAALMEHFSSVQIFVTATDGADGGTIGASRGAGNQYAIYGQIKQWVLEQEREETD
jgi:hypothetical protein